MKTGEAILVPFLAGILFAKPGAMEKDAMEGHFLEQIRDRLLDRSKKIESRFIQANSLADREENQTPSEFVDMAQSLEQPKSWLE